jgi:hypothetical protein
MTEGLGSTTTPTCNGSEAHAPGRKPRERSKIARTLIYAGFLAVSAGIAYAAVRGAFTRPPLDPTTERIRSLIDEANRLLKELDDKRSG